MGKEMDRRRFLKVLGVTGGGAAALSGCSSDAAERFIPYLVPPDYQIPGIPTYYATTCRECPAGCGLHVKVREGRAIKVEGNPESPINGGALCARGQASLQGLYNPDRLRGPMARGANGAFGPISWDDALARVTQALAGVEGDRVWFLTGNEAGSFDTLVNEWLAAVGSRNRVVYEPFGYEALRHASREIFGLDTVPEYRFADATFVLSFGTDFLETWLNPVQHAREFAASHSFADGQMGRYVHVDARLGMTAISADEWIAPRPGTEGLLAMAIANVVLRDHGQNAPRDSSRLRAVLNQYEPETAAERCGVPADKIRQLAAEFSAAPSLAVAGGMGAQHDDAHSTAAAAHILNYVAGNVGRTVVFGAERDPAAGSTYRRVTDLVSAMRDGRVGALFIHGANPAYAAPRDVGFAEGMGQVGLKVSFSRFMDETAMLADLILPDHDPLEQWNDFEPQAGAYLLQQPVMQPVFDTRQTGDVLLQLAGAMGGVPAARVSAANYKEYLQQRWQQIQRLLRDGSPFEDFWIESLRVGGVHRDAPPRPVRVVGTASRVAVAGWSGLGDDLTLIAYPSPALFDGRGANRPWLQELPDPVSKIAWSSWVELHPDTAAALGIAEGDVLEVSSAAGSVTAPAFLYPGISPNVVAMPIGQGHTAFGRYAENRGANVYHLLGSEPTAFDGLSHYAAVTIRNTGEHERLATNVGRSRQMGRGISQSTTLHAITSGEDHPFHIEHAAEVPEHVERVLEDVQEAQTQETKRGNYAGEHPRWAMAVDLSRCTGCSACVTACYAENNIPTVGKELVQHGREMSWLRIERYFEGGGDEPLHVELLPMMCQQCGRAPCEPVCPVFAAYHTPDGLNAQIYNRCVGTRYCANNCPYKVRYFNWFDHQQQADAAFAWPDPLHMLLNPNVTVRTKGVMEKCTFCVQRIRGAQNQARLEGRDGLRDGEVQTACQQTCPSEALVFGDLNDPDSAVSRLAASERGYHVLEGLNTAPAVTYLKKVRNVAGEG